ncbi:MAG TPA: glycerate kinase [Acidimicrobiales bacterium]|jgi:glycerate kinase|nr:glycerate kinase [Acidimicrobiales bacterium]
MPHLVAAPDKFRGTVSATNAAAAAAAAARDAGWTADEVPMSDGGEGLLDACGGTPRRTTVSGPLGSAVKAEWRMLADNDAPRTAVVEMSKAAGRALVPRPRGDDPVRASTAGVGQLLLAARDAGARRIVVGCGGSATTDGGEGAFDAVGSPGALHGVELVVASDVTTAFADAAAVFGPQKGASAAQVVALTARLAEIAERYRREVGVDVTDVRGAGAAGGLAGGLVALGARIEPGFDFVAALVGLADRLDPADIVMTGEGHFDPPSLHGKVPGGVLEMARARSARGRPLPVLCVAGGVDAALLDHPPAGMELVSLVARFGGARARAETAALIRQVTAEMLPRFCP